MIELLSQLNDIERRSLLRATALGVSLFPGLENAIQAAPGSNSVQAKRLVYLFMAGAMSHLDTFDVKPGHKNQGLTQPINTNVAGMQVSHYLPMLSQHFDNLAVIRSMNTPTGAHLPGEYLMRTSYEQIATTQHPRHC